jgi:hypothetical protein
MITIGDLAGAGGMSVMGASEELPKFDEQLRSDDRRSHEERCHQIVDHSSSVARQAS